MDRPTTLAMMRALERRDIQKSKSPKGSIFVQEVLPVMSAVGGGIIATLAARKMPGAGAAALGGGIAAAGNLPRFLADARRARELRPVLQGRQKRQDLRNLELASMAGLGSAVLGGVGSGMKPSGLSKLVNATSWGLFVPAVGTALYQKYRKQNPRITE